MQEEVDSALEANPELAGPQTSAPSAHVPPVSTPSYIPPYIPPANDDAVQGAVPETHAMPVAAPQPAATTDVVEAAPDTAQP